MGKCKKIIIIVISHHTQIEFQFNILHQLLNKLQHIIYIDYAPSKYDWLRNNGQTQTADSTDSNTSYVYI